MRAKDFIVELNIDNDAGWGQTPNNANVGYKGALVKMRPSIFLKLSAGLELDNEAKGKIATMVQHHKSGGKFGAPTLYITIPKEWEEGDFSQGHGRVGGHEGRHRMNAALEVNGDVPVETHIFISGFRTKNWAKDNANDYSPEIMQRLAAELESEDGIVFSSAPLFTL